MNNLDSPIKHFSLTDTDFFIGKGIEVAKFYKDFFKAVRRKNMFKLTPSALKRKIVHQKIESNTHIVNQTKIKNYRPSDNLIKII